MPQVIPAVASWVTSAIVAVGATVGLNAAASLAIAKFVATTWISAELNKSPKLKGTGQQLDFKADTNAGIPIPIGRTAVGGNLVFQYPSAHDNIHMNLIAVLGGCGPIDSIESFTADAIEVDFDSDGSPTNTTKWTPSGRVRMWQTQKLGDTPDTALPQPTYPASIDTLSYWGSSQKLSGYACAWWVCEYDTRVYTSGLPKPQWVIKGVKAYDPRLDSTYPGGSGSHRIDDPTTWEWSNNPYIIGHQFALGWYHNGKRVGGCGIPAAMIETSAFVDAANTADDNGWTIGGTVTTLDSKWQALKAILQAGGGEPVQSGALLSCRISAPRVSLATIGIDDLAGGISVPGMLSRRDRINSVIPRYRSEGHNWEIVAAAPVSNSDYVTFDGALRQQRIDYPLVQDVTQASQLAAYALGDAREFGLIQLQLKPKWMGYKTGDCLTLNLPEAGLNNQKVLVKSKSGPDPKTGIVSMAFVSETDAKHDYALGISGTAPPTSGLTAPDFGSVAAPDSGDWSASADTVTNGGVSVINITVTGTCSNPFTTEIIIEYRVHGASDWNVAAFLSPESTGTLIPGLAGDTSYDVAISYRTLYNVVSDRLEIDSVTTGTVAQPPVYVDESAAPTPTVHSDQPTIDLSFVACAHLVVSTTDASSIYNHDSYIGLDNGLGGGEQNSTFYNNDASYPKRFRVRPGSVTFLVEAYGTVDNWLSIWYEINSSGKVCLGSVEEPGHQQNHTSVSWTGNLTITAGDTITFFVSPLDSSGNYYNPSNKQLLNAGLTVLAFNN